MNLIRIRSGSFRLSEVRRRISIVFAVSLLFGLASCPSKSSPKTPSATVPQNGLELVFTYGSEKEKWIGEATDAFNRQHRRTGAGRTIIVHAIPMGSGEAIDEVMEGRRQPHLISPASAAFIKLGNAQSQSKYGRDLISSTDNLVLSPVVIAMWKPMAEALGWGKKPIGWSDILAQARSQKGWEAYGFPQWGRFKFGHTHPQFSNSGLISLFAEVYAGSGKTAGLTAADVNKPHTAEFLAGIEKSVVHKLLVARHHLQSPTNGETEQTLEKKVQELDQDLRAGSEESESLRQSKLATLNILKRRLATMARRKQTLEEIESDLTRIDNQVDLILENATVQGKPQTIATDIELASDLIGGSIFGDDESAISALDQTYERQKPDPQKETA